MTTAEKLKPPSGNAIHLIKEGEIEGEIKAITDWLRGGRLPPEDMGTGNNIIFTIDNKRAQTPNKI